MNSIKDQYIQMDVEQLINTYKSSVGLHKRIIEEVFLERNIPIPRNLSFKGYKKTEENVEEQIMSMSIPDLMQKLKSNTLKIKTRSLIEDAFLERADEFEDYAYKVFGTQDFSHKLVQPLELSYRLSLIEIEKLADVIKAGKEYEAIDLLQAPLETIIEIHDILLSHYNRLRDNVLFLKEFEANKMKQYNYSLVNLDSSEINSDLSEEKNYSSRSSDTVIEQRLLELGYHSKHPFIKSNILNKCEYFFKVLTDLIEPDYVYKNYEAIHDFTDTMTPEEYESYCATILEDNGWEASLTKGTGDQGADVIGRKNGLVVIIQCKLYSSPVGNKAVQEVHAALSHYNGKYGIVVTNNTFTQSAVELAKSTNTILTHHNNLINILDELNSN